MATTLDKEQEKLDKIEAKKQQLQQRAQALKATLRKKENALKYTHGGLVKKAGLADLSETQLLGLLLEQKAKLDTDTSILSTWDAAAAAVVVKAKKQPVIIKFEDQPTDDIKTLLKSHKLRWNRYAQHWEGDVSGQALDDIAAQIGDGPITRVQT